MHIYLSFPSQQKINDIPDIIALMHNRTAYTRDTVGLIHDMIRLDCLKVTLQVLYLLLIRIPLC